MYPGISEVEKLVGLDRHTIYTTAVHGYSYYVCLVF